MSDNSSLPTPEGVSQSTAKPAGGTSSTRLVILLLVLGVALAGLLYDYLVARPGIKLADQKIQGLLEGTTPDPNGDGTVTEDEVQQILGRQPSSVQPLTNGKIEVYTWRSGLPSRTYKLYVVYSGQKLPLLYSASTNEEPSGEQLPPQTIMQQELTQEELENFVPRKITGAGMGGGPEAGGGKKGGGGKKSADAPDQGTEQPPAEPAQDEPENATDDPAETTEDDGSL